VILSLSQSLLSLDVTYFNVIGLECFIVFDPIKKLILKRVNFVKKQHKECIAFDGVYKDKSGCVEIVTACIKSKKESHSAKVSNREFALTVHSLTYIPNNPINLNHYSLDLEFSNPLSKKSSGIKTLIVRPDHSNSTINFILNSTHKYYCQILMFSLHSKYCNPLINTQLDIFIL